MLTRITFVLIVASTLVAERGVARANPEPWPWDDFVEAQYDYDVKSFPPEGFGQTDTANDASNSVGDNDAKAPASNGGSCAVRDRVVDSGLASAFGLVALLGVLRSRRA